MDENKDISTVDGEATEDVAADVNEKKEETIPEIEDMPPVHESTEEEHYEKDEKIVEHHQRKDREKEEKEARARSIFDFVELLFYAFAVILILFTFVARVTVVEGDSMMKTLYDGDRLLISNIGYTPKAGDIVVFQSSNEKYSEPVIKRVIATEGQVVDIDFDTWTLTVDGVVIDESAYRYFAPGYPLLEADYEFPITVEEGHIFVLGDNRNNSRDSRDDSIGQVDTRTILGRVILRLSLSKFGAVK